MSSNPALVPHHPHDAFFKEVFADPVNARDLIQRHAPPKLVALLDLDTLEALDTSFIDEDLRQHFADLAFRVKLKSGNEAYICLLLEHKSYPDKWVLLQILRYELQIWDNTRKQSAQSLPIVFPMVVYHGKRKWRVAKQFHSLFNLVGLQPLQQYVPDFGYHLFDLNTLNDEALTDVGLVNAALGAMKHIFDPAMQAQLGQILRRLRGLPPDKMQRAVQIVLRYVMMSATHLTRAQFEQVVQTEVGDEQTQEGMMTLAQQLISEGKQVGLLEGEVRGKQVGLLEGKQVGLLEGKQVGLLEGEVRGKQVGLLEGKQVGLLDITSRLIRRRFGDVPTDIVPLVRKLSTEQLADLGEMLLDVVHVDQLRYWLAAQLLISQPK